MDPGKGGPGKGDASGAAAPASSVAPAAGGAPASASPPASGSTPAGGPAAPYASARAVPTPAIFAPGTISTGDDESTPTFSQDGQTLYYLKNAPGFNHWTILITHFRDGAWSTPEVAPWSGQYGDGDVAFTPDRKRMFFVSNRPASGTGPANAETDIWTMTADGDGWSAPRRVAELSGDGNDWYPTVADSGTVYFGSERRAGNLGTPGTSDFWRARLVNGRYTAPENLGPVINTNGNDIEAYVAPDESYLIFASNARPDTKGSYDLYLSFQCGSTWTPPRHLEQEINSAGWEFTPRLSPDGRYFFFTSNRGFADRPIDKPLTYPQLLERLRSPGNGLRDIYQVDVKTLNIQSPCGRG